jgi:hypothetical protein
MKGREVEGGRNSPAKETRRSFTSLYASLSGFRDNQDNIYH